jgi:Tfp pilus assembly protein FimT
MSAVVFNKVSVRSTGNRKAFTLLEVLASFVLMAIIIPVAMKGVSLGTRLTSKSKQQVEAASLARTKLAEILACEEWKNGNSSGDFGKEWPDYRWSMEINSWIQASLSQLDLQVFWFAQGREQSITLTTLVYTESG